MKKREIMMVLTVALMLLALSYPASAWRETEVSKNVKLPEKIEIVPPASDLPKEISRWTGRYEGIWDFDMPCVLVVNKITSPKKMNVLYARGGNVMGRNLATYDFMTAKVLDNGKKIEIYFPARQGSGIVITFEMEENSKIIQGHAKSDRHTNKIKMERVEE